MKVKKSALFLFYLLISSYLNVGFVGFLHPVQAQSPVFQDDFNDNSLDTSKWTEDVVGSGNSYTEANGEAQFITHGGRTGNYGTEHAFLRSSVISIENWSYVVFSGKWKFTDPGTAEMWFRIYDADSGKYLGVRYVSWTTEIAYDRVEGTISESRSAPQTYVPFRIVLYKDHFEYWENGNLVKTIETITMESTTNFQLVIGGWDDTPTDSHMYFDNIVVEYEEAAPPEESLKVTILSPEERTYNTATIDLNVTANKPVDEWRYSLNGGKNVTFEPNTTITAQNGENLLVVYALAGDETGVAQVNFYVNASGEDETPPGTVRNLAHEVGADYIHWTWDNPEDEDFETALVYIDGKFEGETDEGEWWLDELLPGETHTIGILTRDYSGNVNTTWVNDTATTLTPAETVYVNESGWWYEGGSLNPSETPLQDGIKNAIEGGTVVVLAGTYPESVEIGKFLTVETSESARITGDGSELDTGRKPVFYVSSNNVVLRGFVIPSSVSNIGVWVDGVENCTIEDNTITITETGESERYGIYLSYGGGNIIRDNDVSVSGFQGVGIYVYEEEGEASDVHDNTVTVRGDSADGIEVFYTSTWVYDNTISISGVGENAGYALYLYLAGDSFIDNNELTTNLSETNAWAIIVIAEFYGSLSGNTINGIPTEVTCPGNCLVRGVPPENRPAPPEGYGDVGEYIEIDVDSWLHLGLYYDDSALEGLNENSLQIWHFTEGWTLDGTSGHHLDTNKNLVEANLTGLGIFAPLAQEENDITPPVLTFVEPTPKDGSLIGDSSVVINVTSNENLTMATLEFDGANHTMLGSGKEWHYTMSVADGTHTFRVYGQDLAGNNGTSEEREFEVDTKAPEYSNVGQDAEGIPPGGEVHVHAFWSDPHLRGAVLYTNITGSWEVFDEVVFEGTEGWSNFSISMDEPDLYCWKITGYDALDHESTTPVHCFVVYSPPEIVSYSPESPVESYVGDTVEFSVTVDQTVNVTWYLDGSIVKTEENVETSTYTNSDVGEGEHSVRAVVENSNGSASHFWAWYVYPKPGLTVSFVEPTPENGAMLNVRRVIINVSSSLDLDNATLEWNGANESMSGSGRSWWAVKENLADGTYAFRVYGSAEGITNHTEERTVEIDATAPRFLEYGQAEDEVMAGDKAKVFAKWTDAHLEGAVLVTNATLVDGTFVWSEVPLQIANGWSNGTISTEENFAGKVFCWYIKANDTFGNGNETPKLCFRVEEGLRIVSFSPESNDITVWDNESVSFSIELNKAANVTWFVNNTEVLAEEGTYSEYHNDTLIPGVWNVTVVARRDGREVSHSWKLTVKTDTTPPVLTFLPPTPENGSLVGDSLVVFNLTSSEELSQATLYFDETAYPMEGSGREWWVSLNAGDGNHEFHATGKDMHGNEGATGVVVFEIDTTAPRYVSYGQESESVLQGEDVTVYALWNEAHPSIAKLKTNATESGEWTTVVTSEYSSWTNFTISTEGLSGGTYCWIIEAEDTLGHVNSTPLECFRVIEPLKIVSSSPEGEEVEVFQNETVTFSIALNQVANVTWAVNGTVVLEEEGNGSTYTNSTLIPGLWNVSVRAENENGVARRWWLMRVVKRESPLKIVVLAPENGSRIKGSWVTVEAEASRELLLAVLELDGVNHTMLGSGRSWNLNVSLTDGHHVLRIYGMDAAGTRAKSGELTFESDGNPPEITVNCPDTVDEGDLVTVEVSIHDIHPASYEIYRDSVLQEEGIYSSNTTLRVVFQAHEPGMVEYKVWANDTFGWESERTVQIRVRDTTPPRLILLPPTPENGSILNKNSVKFRLLSNENLSRAVLNFNGAVYVMMGSGRNWSISLTIEDGHYEFYVGAWDTAGNFNETEHRTFTVDTTPPELWFIQPTPENDSLLGASQLTFNIVAGERLSSALLELDGVNHTMEGDEEDWNITIPIPDGRHVFRVYGIDLGGNIGSTETRVVETDTAPPVVHDKLVNLTLEWERDGIYSTHAERGLKAGLLINVTEPHPGHYDVYFNPDANDPNHGWVELYSGNYTSGVPFFVRFNTSEPAYVMYYIEVYDALGHGTYGKYFFLRVRDTVPPAKIEVLAVTTFAGGAEVGWINPSDEDFNHTELWINETLVGNFTGEPGLWDGTTLTLTPGETYNISVVPVDRYGNRGEATWKSVTIPYPSLNAGYALLTPSDGAELPPETEEITVRIESSDSFASCTLSWDGHYYRLRVKTAWISYIDDKGHLHTKRIYYCEKTFSGHLNGEHSFYAVVYDGYGHFRSLPTRHITVKWPCFKDCTLEITSPRGNVMNLLVPINFTMDTNAPPTNYTFTIENIEHTEPFTPNVSYSWVDDHLSLNGSFLLDLSPFMKELKEEGARGELLSLVITAMDSCGRELRAETEFSVCSGNERPELAVKIVDEARPGEEVILHAEVKDKNGNLQGIYVSINGGEYMDYSEDMDISPYLQPYANNVVRVKAVDTCGAATVEAFKVRISGPPVQGDWLVNNTQLCSGKSYTVNGSILITSRGSLELRNCQISVLGDGVQVNGTLKVLQNSVIRGTSLNLSGENGNMDVSDSRLSGFEGGTFTGNAEFISSTLDGEFNFSLSNVTVRNSDVNGGITVSGSLNVENSIFHRGMGLTYLRPVWNSPGSLRIVNSTFRNNEFGIKFLGVASDWHWTMENLLIENNRECGLCLEAPRYGYATEELKNVTLRNNGKGVCAKNVRLSFRDSLIESNGERNFELDLSNNWIYLYDTNVTGSEYAFHAQNVGGIELHDVNLTGDVSPYPGYLMVYVSGGKVSTLESGKAGRLYAHVNGKLRLRSYTVEGGKIEVKPEGTLRVEDVDGIPATDDLDKDASVLRNIIIEGLSSNIGQSHIVILNSRLEGSTFGTLSTDALITGCRIDGGSVSFSTWMFWSHENTEVRETAVGENAEWFYSMSKPADNWMYTTETTGMSTGSAPFSADMYHSSFTSGTEVGEFTDLYLKKVVNFEKLPVQAWLNYYAISGVEIYVNGKKVVDELNHEAQLSFVYGWGGGRISATPLIDFVDLAGYLRSGENVIAVHVRSPNRYPYLQLGAFEATLYTVSGVAGLRDSVVNAPVYGSAARLIIANDEIYSNVTSSFYSRIRISNSRIRGSVKVSGRMEIEKSEITGDGTGYGVWSENPFDVIINESTMGGFDYGIHLHPMGSSGSVKVISSKITENEVGLWTYRAAVDVRGSYVMHNTKGMELLSVNGTIYNDLFFDNDVGIDIWVSEGTSTLIDHNTITGGNVGISIPQGSGGVVSLTNSLVQNNDLGIFMAGNAVLTLENNSLVNRKGIHLTTGASAINNTDWGGHEPRLVENFTGGTMYTASGEVETNYDILDERGAVSLGSTVSTGPGWGSSLLGVSLDVYPMSNGDVKGVISLAGGASSRSPIVAVNYTLIYNGMEELLNESSLNSTEYYGYITLDTVGKNLTGTGYLKFTAKNAEGTSISAIRKVYFRNVDIKIVSYSISHPTAVYVYRRDPDVFGTAIPYDERFANVSVLLKNIGELTGVAKIELVLPEYIERHTGKVSLLVAVPGNMEGYFNALIPITDFDPITLRWDPLPDELPSDGKIPIKIRLYDLDGVLRDERNATIEFDLGPVFKINGYDAYPYTRQWCQISGECSVKNYGLNSYTYDGDGDGNLEAAESHHFDLIIENIGDREVYLKSLSVRDYIPERDPNLHNKLLKRNSVTLLGGSDETFMADVWAKNLTRLVKPGQVRYVYGAWMPWWLDAPPTYIPPVNFSGEYMSTANVLYYETINGQPLPGYYVTIPINYMKTPVKALDKSFVPFTEYVGPVQVDVIGVNGDKTYLKLKNTNDNIYYSYYAEGDYDMEPEGYVWYHVIPPGFEFRAIADHSKEPGTVIPHYRVTVGVEYSLLFNEIDLIAIGVEGALGVYDIDVPVRTIVAAMAKSMLKITNIVENIDFPDEDKNFTWMAQNSPETNALIEADDATYAAVINLDTMARLEQNYGMDRDFYEDVANFDSLSLPEEIEVVKKYGTAIIGDEDLQMLLLETVLEIVDNDILNEIYKEAQDAANPPSPEEEMAEEFSEASKKAAKEIAQELIVKELKKKKSFQSLSPKEQKKALKDAKGTIAAAVDTFITLGEWAFYNIYATLTQPTPMSIQVLDPPANYTVEAQKFDTAILLGGEGGSLDGWGNVSLTFGEPDVYRAEYIVPTPLMRVGPLFNGTLEGMSVEITGTRKGAMLGELRMELRPDPRNASMVFAIFRNEAFARAFVSPYLTKVDSLDVEIKDNTIILSAKGELVALPEDEGIHITMNAGKLFTNATIERMGTYRGSVELRSAFGIDPSKVETTVGGSVKILEGNEDGSVLIAVPKNGTLEPPEVTITPEKLYTGGEVTIKTSKPCSLSWKLGNLAGSGDFVPTRGLKAGNYTLTVTCLYGNLTEKKNYTVELVEKPITEKEADGDIVSAEPGKWVRVSTRTDLYRIYFLPKVKVNGMVAVYQRPGDVEAPEGYDYVTYSIFNVTHPENLSIANATLRFRVSKEWLRASNVSKDSLLLLHLENGWVEYGPVFEYEDLEYVYYRVNVPSLSLFAVASKVKVETHEEHETPTETPTHTESPAETTSTPVQSSQEGGNTACYILAALAILVLIGVYVYRRR
ncbi:right-handed parallel beta-helix repeat-containing protein [Thermococcus gammatolerans]|uniref:right-handed parallel beta-helix repeat-containing protein n=1 Tax=Thermococcus gammatolerans TaxID=187878 RepID=UPI0011D1447B|nr:right-handed parallel beta-helix repeat-containing protein [Thermococcus gammatolerans]